MTQLRICLLGTPEIWHGGAPLKLPTRKALALLVYLAVEGGTQRRDKLIALLWPDSDEQQGRASLRNTLSYLNRALRDVDDAAHLDATRDTVALIPGADLWIDAQQLQTELSLNSEDLMALYRGDFLEGFSLNDSADFDDWVSSRREQFHDRMVTVLHRAVQEHNEQGASAAALTLARSWVKLDQLNEQAHSWLIRILIAKGDRTGALHAYERLSTVLENDLGIQPSSEIRALVERLNDDLPAVPRVEKTVSATMRTLPESPFIGRTAEVGELTQAYRAVVHRQTLTVALVGEAGMGKTRLAVQFTQWARAEGAQIVRGRSFESQNPLPYYPIIELLRALDPSLAPARKRSNLVKLLPELQRPEAETDPNDTISQSQMFEGVTAWIQSEAEKRTLVLFLDDVQWLDSASRDLIRFAVRHWTANRARILLLLTVRSEDIQDRVELSAWLSSLSREVPLQRIALGPLGQDETIQLIQAFGVEEWASYGAWLFANAQGHPLYMLETLKDLFERGTVTLSRSRDGELRIHFAEMPPTTTYIASAVRELIRTRLARLSTEGMFLLAASSVLGQDIRFEILRTVADFEETEALNILDELLERRLLVESGTVPLYNFTHDKVREVAYEKMNTARRRALHRRAFETLLQTASPAVLVHHALEGHIEDSAQVAAWCIKAGDAALEVFAARDAIYYYELARQFRGAPLDAALTLNLGRAYELNAQAGSARAIYDEFLAQPDHSVSSQVATMNRLAILYAQAFETQGAIEILQRALVAAHSTGDAILRAETQLNLANATYYRGDFDSAYIYGEGALKWANDLGNPGLLARSKNLMAYIHSARGNQQAAIVCADEAAALYAELGDRAMEMDSLGMKANALLRCGDTAPALDLAQRVLAVSQQLENPWGQVSCLLQIAQGLRDLGQIEQAAREAQRALQIATNTQIPLLVPFAGIVLAAVQRAAGRWDESIRLLGEVLNGKLSAEAIALVKAELCATCALAGQWPQAADYARQLIDAALHPLMLVERRIDLEVESLLRANDRKGAGQLLEQFARSAGDSPRDQAVLHQARQRIASS